MVDKLTAEKNQVRTEVPGNLAEKNGSGMVSERMLMIQQEKVHPDPDFPAVQTSRYMAEEQDRMAYQYAFQAVDSRYQGDTTATAEVTKFSGRAVYKDNRVVLETADGRRTVRVMKIKPSGVSGLVRDSWPDYQGQQSPFFHHEPKNPFGDQRQDLVKKADFLGLAYPGDMKGDAINSLIFHERGIKSRLPIAGWSVDSFKVWDEDKGELVDRDITWFRDQGFGGDELRQAAFGLSIPITGEDANSILNEHMFGTEINDKGVREFIATVVDYAKDDKTEEYQALYAKWKDRLSGEPLTRDEMVVALEDFGVALSVTMGRNYHLAFTPDKDGKRYTHSNLHDQNFSFFGEWADNSNAHEGLLEIGLAPENSADISGFNMFLQGYAKAILRLKHGENWSPYNNENEVRQYVETKFNSAVREAWPSYKEYCDLNYESKFQKKWDEGYSRIKDDLAYYHGEEHVTDKMIEERVQESIGRKEFPFGGAPVELSVAHDIGVLEKPLSDSQKDRLGMVLNNPYYKQAIETALSTPGLSQLGIYGGFGMAVGIEHLKPEKAALHEFSYDEARTGDLDLAVSGLSKYGFEKFASELQSAYKWAKTPVEVVVTKGDYPRVEVRREGVELVSFSDIDASVVYVDKVREAIGQVVTGSAWEKYISSMRLKNMSAILLGESQEKNSRESLMDNASIVGFEDGGTTLIKINTLAIESAENARELYRIGEKELAAEVLSGMASWVGRMVLLSSSQGFGIFMEDVYAMARSDMKYLNEARSQNFRDAFSARERLAGRLMRAAGADSMRFLMESAKTGALLPFSQTLDQTMSDWLNSASSHERTWMQSMLVAVSEEKSLPKGMDTYLTAIGYGLVLDNDTFTKVATEMGTTWPYWLEAQKGWDGEPVSGSLHQELMRRMWADAPFYARVWPWQIQKRKAEELSHLMSVRVKEYFGEKEKA
jgi:hypothetical protein